MFLRGIRRRLGNSIFPTYSFSTDVQTKLAQAGCTVDSADKNLTPNLVFSTTFEREKDLSYQSHVYSRMSNPTRNLLEETLADLEYGSSCCAFASGNAATSSLITAVGPRTHIVIGTDVYHGTRSLLENVFSQWGLTHSEIDLTDIYSLKHEIEAVKSDEPDKGIVVISEIPTNPLLKVPDICEISTLLQDYEKCIHVCDSTWVSPAICNPLKLGADMVLHSTTKYMGGHSDMLGGCIVFKQYENHEQDIYAKEIFDQIRVVQQQSGGVASPFDCWLLLRGLRSLDARIRLHCENALAVAEFLSSHESIKQINYPGLKSHPQHDVMSKIVRNNRFGGMLSVQVHGGEEKAIEFCSKVSIFKRATSLGGTESLIEHRRSVEPPNSPTPSDLLRLSIGLENVDDLIGDLENALRGL